MTAETPKDDYRWRPPRVREADLSSVPTVLKPIAIRNVVLAEASRKALKVKKAELFRVLT